ncbi:MAG: hypothetical protein LBT24_02460 [Tannerella sp.]|jgi:hypothetical protein|nr:hypothetical protein [Tannerella sp.]
MKQKYYLLGGLLLVTVICLLLAGCEKKEEVEKVSDDEKMSVDKTELTFTQKGENKEFNVSCDGTEEWHLEADGLERYIGPNMADVKDFTIEPVSGMGKTKVSVTLNSELTGSYVVDLKVVGKNNQEVVKLKANVNVY